METKLFNLRVCLTIVLGATFGSAAGYTTYSAGCGDETPPPSPHFDAGAEDDAGAILANAEEDAGAE